ncbi:hypothetical protein C100_18160 [Sphingobium sp. C100]|jgi:iron complex outermembrane recepter protein|uniref:TonB-dependent receptor n=1 Tax=Sphingobium sp. C100 TaxID=1207055 RepID=UPI0003D5EB4F|nr:TonB-dependent receptor [Sphingobium sp. C100]ETI61217.1 hypothetical protein C100_18160 [Sphingobium sp. C100]PHQ64064.1 MAG: hypothetical protein COC10_02895 [Sphingobium sp.]
MNSKISVIALAIASCANAPWAIAQTDTAGASASLDDRSVGTEDIIVTARRRQESILRIPVSETVVSGAALEKFGVTDIAGISQRTPGLLVATQTGSFGNQLSLRGIGTNVLNSAIDQSVALNIDGMPFSQGIAYQVGFFDLAQAEVIRGPQALFYGKAASAGVIALHTADPTDRFELIGRGDYEFTSQEKRAELIISGPVTETLGLRVGGYYSDQDGYFRNRATGGGVNGGITPTTQDTPTREFIGRVTALWKPLAGLSIRLKANYNWRKDQAYGLQLGSCLEGTTPVAPTNIPWIVGDDCKLDRNYNFVWMDPAAYPGIRNGGVPFRKTEQYFGIANIDYDAGNGLSIASVTGYYHLDNASLTNSQQTTNFGPANVADVDFAREDFTQELRLASDWRDRPINFTLGIFYQDASMFFQNNSIGNATLGFPAKVIYGTHDIKVEALSTFGQLLWKIMPELELAGGARWTYEQRTHEIFNQNTNMPVRLAVPKISSNRVNPEVSLTYTPTSSLTLFGSYREASKSGSFNAVNVVANGTDTSFGDEKAGGFEIGTKGRLFNNSLTYSLSAYTYKYKDLQVGANEIGAGGVILIRTLNAASVRTKGVDFEANWRTPMTGLTLNGAVNYNHARYIAFPNAQCWGGQTIAQGCNQLLSPTTGRFSAQDLSGRELQRAPAWTATFGFDYTTPLSDGLNLVLSSSNQYVSSFYTNLLLRSDMVQDGYLKSDVSLALSGPERKWEISLIGRNLQNEITASACTNAPFQAGGRIPGISGSTSSGAAGQDELSCFTDRGREVRVRASFRF